MNYFSFTISILNYLKYQKTRGTICFQSNFTESDQVSHGLRQMGGVGKPADFTKSCPISGHNHKG